MLSEILNIKPLTIILKRELDRVKYRLSQTIINGGTFQTSLPGYYIVVPILKLDTKGLLTGHQDIINRINNDMKINTVNDRIKISMLILRNRKDCIISKLPRRLLIYLLEYIQNIKIPYHRFKVDKIVKRKREKDPNFNFILKEKKIKNKK